MDALYVARDREIAEYMFATVSEETKKEFKEELGNNRDQFLERLRQGEFEDDEASTALIVLFAAHADAISLNDIIRGALCPLERD